MSQKTELLRKRKSNTRAALELAIAGAVRQSDQQCNGLKAVVIERVVSKPPRNANWAIKGVKYGRAERDRCSHLVWSSLLAADPCNGHSRPSDRSPIALAKCLRRETDRTRPVTAPC
jgi:hypothetical protein